MNVEQVILPGTGAELLRRELATAFSSAGCRVQEAHPAALHDPAHAERLSELLDGRPTLLFSVNFQGLTPLRPTLDMLKAARGAAAVWCVDNPWNLLAGMRDPRWKSLPIYVTDESFVGPLREHGAERVFHLPLAAAPELFSPDPRREHCYPPPNNLAPFVFVGRSAFPGKDAFFAGQTLPEDLTGKVGAILEQGERPDFNWWEEALGCGRGEFWPGKKARRPALGAEEANLAWRSLCLRAAAKAAAGSAALDIFGDTGWRALLPKGARLREPVDYYTRLPGIYANARFSLCLTSLQLPRGLNQRHFDVWMAGGFCLSDATPGLALFPDELVRPVTFSHPAQIPALAEKADLRRAELIAGWREHLLEKHCYSHRVRVVLEYLERGSVCEGAR